MKTSSILWGLLIAILVVAAGWYWMQGSHSAAPSVQTQSAQPASTTNPNQQQSNPAAQSDGTGPAVNLTLGTDSNPKVGTYLIGYTGKTLYTYAKDTNNKSNCTGACAQAWPPYTLPAGTPINLQAGVSGTVSMISRDDGSWQVSYNGHPLYFYAGDKPGSNVNGQGVGGAWYVAKP